MAFIKLIFLLITISILTTFAKKSIQIGGIFHPDNYEAETAFRLAINRENMFNTMIEFLPIVKIIDRNDSVLAEEIACGLASNGVAAIFGPSSVQTSKIVGSICNELHIPHIMANWIPEDEIDAREHHQFTRNFFPDNDLYAKALSQIIVEYDWRGFAFIYEHSDSLERLLSILQLRGPEDSPVTIHQLPAKTDDYKSILKEIKNSAENRIIIDCSPENVMELLKQAPLVNMMDYENYIIISLDSHLLDFAELEFFPSNIMTLSIIDPLSVEAMTAVDDWQHHEIMNNSSTNADSIKTEAALYDDAVRVFATAFTESNAIRDITPTSLACTDSKTFNYGMQILQMMDQATVEGMTGRRAFDYNGRRNDFYMEILELHQDGFKKIATLDPKDLHINYLRTEDEIYSHVTESIQNKTFIVSARLGMPFLRLKDPQDGEYLEGNDRFEGYSLDLMDGIAKMLGISYQFEIVTDGRYGSFNKETKQWNGLIKELIDRKADMAIGDLTITSERRTAVDFTVPFMTTGISILYAKPHIGPPGLFSFMSPLSLDVWLNIGTAYILMTILIGFLTMIGTDDSDSPPPVAISQNWIWFTGSIMHQGIHMVPKATSTRLTACLWWFFGLVVVSSYLANMFAFLTMVQMDESIENVEDLSRQSIIRYGAVEGGSTISFFKKSHYSTYQRMWEAMESASPSVLVKSNDEGVDRVRQGNGKYAFLMESAAIEYIIERNCDLTQVGGLLDVKGYGIAMPINSPYRTLIDQVILKLQEEGRLHELKSKWWFEENYCDIKNVYDDYNPELRLDHVFGCFLLLFIGILIAIILGILEFFWNVNKISMKHKVTRWDAFRDQLIFAFAFGKTKGPAGVKASTNIERGE